MPAEKRRTVTEIAGDILFERRRSVGDAAAERRGPPAGATRISEALQREAYWKRFLPPEQEQALLAEGQSRQQVSAAVYPRRWELWEQQGELPERLSWAKRMATLGPPEAPLEAPEDDEPTPGPLGGGY